MLKFSCITDKGAIRPNNEDAFVYRTIKHNPEQFDIQSYGCLFSVADGMGGHFAGEIASRIACQYILDYYKIENLTDDNTWEKLKHLYFKINEYVLRQSLNTPDFHGMGTTLSTLIIRKNKAWVAHVGDSRIYLIRDGIIDQVSYDHTEVQRMIDQGLFTKEEAMKCSVRNVLTQAIGVDNRLSVFTWAETIQSGDLFLLCSDGLYDMISDEKILSMIKSHPDDRLKHICKKFIDEAMRAGGKDNMTVMLVKIS
jgi:protein phosphatase